MSVFVQTDSNYFEMECWRDGIMECWRDGVLEQLNKGSIPLTLTCLRLCQVLPANNLTEVGP